MLTLLEEVVLLTIDPKSGRLRGGSHYSVRYALAGAVLFDLALAGRIDTDTATIAVTSKVPTGDPIQDRLLAYLANHDGPCAVRDCVEHVFREREDLEGEALARLVERGIIRHETIKRLWVIDRNRFPLVDGAPQQLVSARLAKAVLGDEIPDIRDIMLVSLASACGLLGVVLATGQIDARADWIRTLSTIETISRNVGAAITALIEDLARSAGHF